MLKRSIYMFGTLVALTIAACVGCKKSANNGEDIYKVEDVGGVPRLTINGEVARSRMLYVSPTYFMLGTPTRREAYPTGRWLETWVEIPALETPVENASLEFVTLRTEAFECYINKLEIVEEESGKKVWQLDIKSPEKQTKFAKGGKNGSLKSEIKKFENENKDAPALVIKSADKATVSFNGVNLDKGKKYRIDIVAKSKNKKVPFDLYISKGGKLLEPKVRSMVGVQTKLAKDAGVDIITFPVQAADFMKEDGSADYSNLKGALDEIVAANPNVKILLRIRCYPPEWWQKKYPEDVMTQSDGKKYKSPSLLSQRFRKDTAKALETIIDFCEKNYDKNIIGYHPGGGNSCEWYYDRSWYSKEIYGYNKSAVEAWQKWVAKKYKTDQALQKAWNDNSATLATVAVPSREERIKRTFFFDTKTQQRLIDYNIFLQDEMVDMVECLGKVIRKKVPNKLSVIFYGYTTDLSRMAKGPASTGHYALWKVANSPYFDMISAPTSYHRRNLGDDGSTLSASETITRCGKIWIDEDDIRTHRTPPSQQTVTSFGKELRKVEDTVQVLQREMARQAIRNHTCWWMDLSGTGWYDDPKMWHLMPDFDKLEKDMIKNPVEFAPEVAVIIDERSVNYVGGGNASKSTTTIIRDSRSLLGSCSVPYGHYLFEDFLYGKKMSPKLAIFPANYPMTAKERKIFRQKTKDIASIFVWLPAYIDLDKNEVSTDATKEATGFDVKLITDDISANLKSTEKGKQIGLPEKFGFDVRFAPLLTPTLKEGDIVLATYQNGMPAVVQRGKHIFCGVAEVPQELYKHAIALSGAHVYTKTGESVWASGAYITVTCTDGIEEVHDVELNIPSNKEIFDAITGEKLGVAPKLILKMKKGDNRILRLGKGNIEFTK